MVAVTFKTPGLREKVENACRDVVEDPQRSIYVKPRTMKYPFREDYPEMSDRQLGNNIGRILNELEYTERWGGETYKLLTDEM